MQQFRGIPKGLRTGLGIGLVALAAVATDASAHSRWKPLGKLHPRSTDSGIKTGPCGGLAVDPTKRVELVKGTTVTLEWEETINHYGHFRIAFSPDGVAFPDEPANGVATTNLTGILKDNITDDKNTTANINDSGTYHQFSTTITVPNTLCETCSMQLVQLMAAGTTDVAPYTYYHSCADVRIVAVASTSTATATATATSTSTATGSSTGTGTDTAADAGSSTDSDTTMDSTTGTKPAAPTGLKILNGAALIDEEETP